MEVWMLDFALLVLAVLMMAVALYKLLFSESTEEPRNAAPPGKPRFERRDAERVDRRRELRAPPGGIERRQMVRR